VGRQLGERVSIAVQDQGSGIAVGDLPHIFEPFFSGSDVMKHSSGQLGYQKRGMGLGLAVAKRFTELHGGTVSVSSGPSGSTFTVSIPSQPPPRPSRPEKPES
ncbi:MAG: sensor histidine kinase, partial [Phycisphaerae bacterium]|nr:sensor histidine kinase [Phycisphaerae bacterium]